MFHIIAFYLKFCSLFQDGCQMQKVKATVPLFDPSAVVVRSFRGLSLMHGRLIELTDSFMPPQTSPGMPVSSTNFLTWSS